MTITLNGSKKSLLPKQTIADLLEELGLHGKPVVVEHNKTALFPRDYDTIQLNDGDSLEIIIIAAGG